MNAPYRLGIVRSLWLSVYLLTVNGCVSMMAEERVGPPVRSEDVREARSIGTPHMTLRTHDDGLGWTVGAEMRTERNTLYKTFKHGVGDATCSHHFRYFLACSNVPLDCCIYSMTIPPAIFFDSGAHAWLCWSRWMG